MNISSLRRRNVVIAVVAIALLGLFLISAPASNRVISGSTWGTTPDGYGAWYDYMQAQGVSIERWQRPIEQLVEQVEDQPTDEPATLLRVVPAALGGQFVGLSGLSGWLEQGNRLIVLSQQKPATAAPFESQISSEWGSVKVATRRRFEEETEFLLADSYGAVVWQDEESSDIILSTTPFLAANAYLDEPGNFEFLAQLVQQPSGPIWVDEYIHGYKDSDVVVEEVAGTWFGYLAETPLLVAVLQAVVVLIVALIAQNRRLGLRKQLPALQVNNSEAYIKALAGVLHKANSHDFLVETLTRAEQKALQRSLGLGEAPVSLATLQTAWQQSTGQSPDQLSVLTSAPKGDSALHSWLRQLQSLHTLVNRKNSTHE